MNRLALTVIALSFASGQIAWSDAPVPALGKIRLTEDLRETGLAQKLKSDYEYFQGLTLKTPLKSLRYRGFQIRGNDTHALWDWLEDRIQFLSSQNLEWSKNSFVQSHDFLFANPGSPPSDQLFQEIRALPAETFHGHNASTYLYLQGKLQGELLGLNLGDLGILSMTSPRVGLVALNTDLLTVPDQERIPVLGEAASWVRLKVLFHEARHSDGNGRSLGFLHSTCPNEIREKTGYTACDSSVNGAYAIGAAILALGAENCLTCDEADREILRAMALSDLSRLETADPRDPQAVFLDETPEGTR